jgi:dipeptidyl aminopeptidase/acylaminoacyl peptidase
MTTTVTRDKVMRELAALEQAKMREPASVRAVASAPGAWLSWIGPERRPFPSEPRRLSLRLPWQELHAIGPSSVFSRFIMLKRLRRVVPATVAGILLLTGVAPAVAQDAGQAGMPPLVDRELFFGNPEIAGAQISPDGAFVAFIRPHQGVRNIWVKRTGEPFDAARPVTADATRPIPDYGWSRDGRFILFVQDQGGDENYNLHVVDPAADPTPGSDVPPARNLTELEGVRVALYSMPRNDPDTVYIGLNNRDPAWHDLYRVSLSTGERTLMRENTDRIGAWVFDLEGQLRLAVRSPENGDTELLRVDEDAFTPIYTCNVFESCSPSRFHPDGERVYMVTNRGDDVNLTRLTLLDLQTGEETLVESDPESRVDLAAAVFSDLTDELISTVYVDDRPRVDWHDEEWEAEYAALQERWPDRQINFVGSTRDERTYLLTAHSDVEPGEVYVYDRDTKEVTFQYQTREELPREALSPMTTVRYPSSDGLEIPAYLTLPKGLEPTNLPLLVVPHGGPWARDGWGYDTLAQFWANRGYAVLQPNFRGSTGYGKAFLDAGNKQWGELMQDDITWGVRHLIQEGIADPERVGIFGGSYGGYATLAGVAFTPDVYAAGVSLVGPSNLLTLLDSFPPYWEAGRKMFYERMGDPTTPEGRAQLERQSPLNSAEDITAPLMVIQGGNDPRVKKAESEQIVIALRDRGFPVEYLMAPDEGHGFAKPVNSMAAFAAAERFLAGHLEGRFQRDATPEVTARLGDITVDPASVVLARAVDASAIGVPTPAVDLQPGRSSYAIRLEMAGQSIPLSSSIEIADDGDTWVITETAKTPTGDATDRTVLSKEGLVLRSRSITQGPVNINLAVADGAITGKMSMGAQGAPINATVDGELFADGAGAPLVMATLPLEEGYTTAFRNFGLQPPAPRTVQLTVVGSESVTVPAGTFDTFTVEVTSPDDANTTTFWVAKESRQVVKTVTTGPALGGGTMTTELTE